MPLLILLADDNPGIRLAVGDYLQLSGYSVITAQNGQDALRLLEEHHPHLLISDIKMPLVDGYSLVEQVRQRLEFRLLPVVFLTERDTTQARIRGYQVGCDAYLPKPFEMEELGAIVRNLLERAQVVQSELRFPSAERASNTVRQQSRSERSEVLALTFSLTKREDEVLQLLAKGLSNADIGQHLHLSPKTIEKYVSNLLRKTDTNNRAELVRVAMENGLVN